MSVLDRVRSAAGDRGWWLSELQGDSTSPAAPVTAADVRLWSWASYSRGARAISYADWTRSWMTGRDGAFTDRAKAAGELAGNLTRNVRLFAPMRPRPSSVAVLNSPEPVVTGGAVAEPGTLAFYEMMFARNIQTDFIEPDAVVAGAATTYRAIYLDPSTPTSPAVEQTLKGYADKGGTLIREAVTDKGGSNARIERLLSSAGVKPEVRIQGAPGLVEARFLESAEAWLLVALNHADTPQTVTMAFAPDVPEAIWMNMESGAEVHFVQGPEGPTYRHKFAARDVMLLMRAKRLR
jgi:hypothetical protein